jgi:hypothetical protein
VNIYSVIGFTDLFNKGVACCAVMVGSNILFFQEHCSFRVIKILVLCNMKTAYVVGATQAVGSSVIACE